MKTLGVRSGGARTRAGFSLVEILLVATVVALLLAAAGYGLKSTWRSQQIAGSAASLAQAFAFAQTTAIKQNRPVQVRIYKFQDGDLATDAVHFRAYQLVAVDPDPAGGDDKLTLLTELQKFEGTTVMSKEKDYSSILATETIMSGGSNPGGESLSYVAVEFRPDGSTDLESEPSDPWTLTLLSDFYAEGSAELPKDARTLIINPDTGMVSVH